MVGTPFTAGQLASHAGTWQQCAGGGWEASGARKGAKDAHLHTVSCLCLPFSSVFKELLNSEVAACSYLKGLPYPRSLGAFGIHITASADAEISLFPPVDHDGPRVSWTLSGPQALLEPQSAHRCSTPKMRLIRIPQDLH